MAALQKIRSKGPILMIIIGLGLFAFIAESGFQSITGLSNADKQKVGEAFGETLTIQDFQNRVEQLSNIAKMQKQRAGQSDALTDQEQDQIREQVWSDFVNTSAIKHETDKAGIQVTDEDVQDALRTGQAQSLQMMAQMGFANQQTGRFDVNALQDFLKNYDKNMAQLAQSGQQAYMEQYQMLRQIWEYTEGQLRNELLKMKFYTLLGQTFISNPISAKMDFDARNTLADVEVAAVPYATVSDKDVKVTDEDLKAAYEKYKEQFINPTKSVDLKVLDVAVEASEKDKAGLTKEVNEVRQKLEAGGDPAAVVNASKTIFPYTTLAMSKNAFSSTPDIAAALDSMGVGSVKPVYYNAQDNTINTLKLINKLQAADSVRYRMIAAVGKTPQESQTRADSILKALQGGAKFDELAKRYNQPTDSIWMYSAQYEAPNVPEDQAKMINQINTLQPGYSVISNAQGSIVVQILERKHIETKYNVAVVKCPLQFSKDTYNAALNKMNRFLAANRTIEAITKNAPREGYIVRDVPNYAQSNQSIQEQIGGSRAKDAVRWLFDEAKVGEVSPLYECGRNNDHLLVLGVTAVNAKGYLPWDNKNVRELLTSVVKQQKKGELLMARLKGVKDMAQAKTQKGVILQMLQGQNFFSQTQLSSLAVPEPKLAGAIARTAQGQFSGAIQGAAAIYFVQVQRKVQGTEKFDAKAEMQRESGNYFQAIYQQSYYGANELLINALVLRNGNVKDNRYRF